MTAASLVVALPAAAQMQKSESYDFLKAVRDRDGTKVNELLGDKTKTVVNSKDRAGDGALHIIVGLADATYLRFILQQDDTNPNLQDKRGNTALNLAASRGWEEGVRILLIYKANVNLANASGETPLIRAVQIPSPSLSRSYVAIADSLLKAGADPDRTDSVTGKSARDYAREGSRWTAMAKLLADAPKTQRGTGTAAGPKL